MSDDLGIVHEFIERLRARQFSSDDLHAFYEEMKERRSALMASASFWQSVYDELLGAGVVTVPPIPDRITERQWKSFRRFNFMLLYIPALTEERYPECFVKLDWTRYVKEGVIQHMPFVGQWIALEMIQLPAAQESVDDPFMDALRVKSRLGLPWDCLGVVPFGRMTKVVGFPKEKTRLPSVEELNFLANLFIWLGKRREMRLPEICRSDTYEWCANPTAGCALVYGTKYLNGLAHVHVMAPDYGGKNIGFRVLVEV